MAHQMGQLLGETTGQFKPNVVDETFNNAS